MSEKVSNGYADAGGVQIAFQVSGNGPPLICGHAMGWDQSLWDDHREQLSKHHQLITFDQRGSGDSDHPHQDQAYTPAAFGQDLQAVLDHLGIERANVLGYSMGAVAALSFAITCPERVTKLILVSAMASRLPEQIIERAKQVEKAVLTDGLEKAYEFYFSGPMFEGTLNKQEIVSKMQKVIAKATRHGFLGCFAVTIDRPSVVDQLSLISAPTLVMVGERDIHYLAEADLITSIIPSSNRVIVPNAGHALTVQNKIEFESQVLNFLK